jgi:hypothetical protein
MCVYFLHGPFCIVESVDTCFRLISKFGDSKIVIRQYTMKLFNILLRCLTPAPFMGGFYAYPVSRHIPPDL